MNARVARLGAVSLLTLAMAGCGALGPDHAVPDNAAVRQPAAQAAFLGAQEASFRREEPPGRWWHLYDDPRLDAWSRTRWRATPACGRPRPTWRARRPWWMRRARSNRRRSA